MNKKRKNFIKNSRKYINNGDIKSLIGVMDYLYSTEIEIYKQIRKTKKI